MPNSQWFRARARELYHVEGEIEIDEKASVSLGGTEGAYVQAWVWVPSEKRKDQPSRTVIKAARPK